jgi:hypothetical protein
MEASSKSMNQAEILSHLKVGRSKSVCVDRSIVAELPQFIRKVDIFHPARVRIGFYNYGHDESGLLFSHEFTSLEDAISFLEIYLKTPILSWENVTKTGFYPSKPLDAVIPELSWSEIKTLLAKTVPAYFYSSQP